MKKQETQTADFTYYIIYNPHSKGWDSFSVRDHIYNCKHDFIARMFHPNIALNENEITPIWGIYKRQGYRIDSFTINTNDIIKGFD